MEKKNVLKLSSLNFIIFSIICFSLMYRYFVSRPLTCHSLFIVKYSTMFFCVIASNSELEKSMKNTARAYSL